MARAKITGLTWRLLQVVFATPLHRTASWIAAGPPRFAPQVLNTAPIETGRMRIPQQASWLKDYIAELITFPRGQYADQVDSTTQALEWIKNTPPEPAIFPIMRRAAGKAGHQGQALRAPRGEPAVLCSGSGLAFCGAQSVNVLDVLLQAMMPPRPRMLARSRARRLAPGALARLGQKRDHPRLVCCYATTSMPRICACPC